MENNKYHTAATIPKSTIEIVKKDKIDTPNTQIHDYSLSMLVICTLIKSGGVLTVMNESSITAINIAKSNIKCCISNSLHYTDINI